VPVKDTAEASRLAPGTGGRKRASTFDLLDDHSMADPAAASEPPPMQVQLLPASDLDTESAGRAVRARASHHARTHAASDNV
jgi:hypothetical protein